MVPLNFNISRPSRFLSCSSSVVWCVPPAYFFWFSAPFASCSAGWFALRTVLRRPCWFTWNSCLCCFYIHYSWLTPRGYRLRRLHFFLVVEVLFIVRPINASISSLSSSCSICTSVMEVLSIHSGSNSFPNPFARLNWASSAPLFLPAPDPPVHARPSSLP